MLFFVNIFFLYFLNNLTFKLILINFILKLIIVFNCYIRFPKPKFYINQNLKNMSFFKKLFGKNKVEQKEKLREELREEPKTEIKIHQPQEQEKEQKEESSDEIKLSWIAAAENPWGYDLLDLRPFSQTMISTSGNQQMAMNAISYGGESGTSFFGLRPKNTKTIAANISFKIDQALYPGVLFTPDTMENKWAVYFHGEFLIFIRSWLREVLVVAKTIQKDNQLIVESITGEFTEDESPEFTKAILNFILISHSIGEIIPAPIPVELQNDTDLASKWAFSTYGNMGQLGIFTTDFLPVSDSALRTHSLLHIAVARGEIKEIEDEFNKGTNLNALAGDGLAPLHWSIASESIDSMAKLLELGADPNGLTHEGATPIMNAVQSNKMDKVKLLLDYGALINVQDHRGFTALHRAAERGHIDIVKFLLQNGADKSISGQGHTALSLAILTQQNEIGQLLN